MIKVTGNGTNINATALWNKALAEAVASGDKTIFFPAGEWHFYPAEATEKYYYVSNNDFGLKKIIFHAADIDDLTICADDARFIFHGRVSPFYLRMCRNVKLSGFAIDFAENFAEEVEVLDSDNGRSWLHVGGNWRIRNGRICFFDDAAEQFNDFLRFNAFEPATGDLVPRGGAFRCGNRVLKSEGRKILLPLTTDEYSRFMFMRHQERLNPGIVIDNCENVTLENIAIHHAEGMGVIAQNSADILLNTVRVVPASGRSIAVTDDATHFSECRGKLVIRNCAMHRTLDDAVNIHGMYRKLRKHGSGFSIEACHFQQFGTFNDHAGDTLELVDPATMKPYAAAELRSVTVYTPQSAGVSFASILPGCTTDGDAVRNLTRGTLDAEICNCDISNNRPRGILLTGVNHGIISGNKIHSPGAGVYISGDANSWFESGPNRSVEICGNEFDHCKYKENSTGIYPITIAPEILRFADNFYYHHNLNVHDNIFRETLLRPVLYARSLQELIFSGNTVIRDDGTSYPPPEPELHHCKSAVIMP